MQNRLSVILAAVLAVLLAACNTVPPTVVVMVISSTPDPRVLQVTVTPSPGPVTATSGQAPNATSTPIAQTAAPVPLGTVVLTSPPTATLDPLPTEVRGQLYIAQEDFEHGFMFWISTKKVIWVLTWTDNPNKGTWREYADTFADGEAEVDPSLTPPANKFQPKRGFGKLWRTTPGLRDQVGWATTPEFNLNTDYIYQAGG